MVATTAVKLWICKCRLKEMLSGFFRWTLFQLA